MLAPVVCCDLEIFYLPGGLTPISCREGKSHPGNRRGTKPSDKTKKVKTGSDNRGLEPTSGDRVIRDHAGGQIANLERLHEQSDVHGSLKMQKGHRLKLDSTHLGQKQKTKAIFEIQFTEVDVPLRIDNPSMDDSPDRDDLPGIDKLLADKKQASPQASAGKEVAHCGSLSMDQVPRQEFQSPHKRRRVGSIRGKTVSTLRCTSQVNR